MDKMEENVKCDFYYSKTHELVLMRRANRADKEYVKSFFKGKISGDSLETFTRDSVLKYIEEGIEVPLKKSGDGTYEEMRIKVSDIPSEAEEIIIWLD